MNEVIAVATITILAVISPGPDFAMVTRNSYTYGIKTGLLCALGIAIGVQVHVFYTVFGITLVIMNSPTLFLIVKLIGVIYLVYIGFKSLTNKVKISSNNAVSRPLSALNAFKNGFLTNALNPKTMFFCSFCVQPSYQYTELNLVKFKLWPIYFFRSLALV